MSPMSPNHRTSLDTEQCLEGQATTITTTTTTTATTAVHGEAPKISNRLSKHKKSHPSLSSHPFIPLDHDQFLSSGTSRDSHTYLAGSLPNLLLENAEREHELQRGVSEAQSPNLSIAERVNLAERRNRPGLKLQSPGASQRSGLAVPHEGASPHVLEAASRTPVSRSKPLAADSPASPFSLQHLRRHSTENEEPKGRGIGSHFTRLNLLPISPLNASFLADYRDASPRQGLFLAHASKPDFSHPVVKPLTSPLSETDHAAACVSMRRRSFMQTPGVATRPPICDESRKPTTLNSPTLAASVLAGTEVVKDARKATKRVQKQLSLPNLPKGYEQERSVTPCESDYRQLGGMKFGTLRITNASPIPGFRGDGTDKKPANPTTCTAPRLSPKDGDYNNVPPRGSLRTASNLSIVESAQSTTNLDTLQKSGMPSHRRTASQPGESTCADALTVAESPTLKRLHKRLSSLMELLEDPRDDFGRGPLSSHPFIPAKESREQGLNQGMVPHHGESVIEYPAKEVLDVINDPNAKPRRGGGSSNTIRSPSARRGMSRSDSGFVSTGSSLSSRRTLSNADSAYSSNASVQSSSTPATEFADWTPAIAKETPWAVKDLDSNAAVTDSSNSTWQIKNDQLATSARPSLMNRSASSLRRLSFRVRQRGHSVSLPDTSWKLANHSHRSSEDSDDTNTSESMTKTISTSSQDSTAEAGDSKAGKLQKLFRGTKNTNDLSRRLALHDGITIVPNVPQEVETRFNQHSKAFPTTSMRLTKQRSVSTESLMTIVSVESRAQYSESNYSRESHYDDSSYYHESTKSHKSQNSIDSIKTLNSFTSVKTIKGNRNYGSTSSSQSMRTAKGSLPEVPLIGPVREAAHYFHNGDASPTIMAMLPPHETPPQMSLKRKPVPIARDEPQHKSFCTVGTKVASPGFQNSDSSSGQSTPRVDATSGTASSRQRMKRYPVRASSNQRALAARASAPDLVAPQAENPAALSSKYVLIDLYKELPLEPARQPILRSSFSRRPRGQYSRESGHNWSSPGGNTDQENVRTCPTTSTKLLQSQSLVELARYQCEVPHEDVWAWALKRKHSTLLHRPAFSETTGMDVLDLHPDGSKPRYRVLHSYNSPAYKNIPIWG
ncbi:hypothetical protein QQS21_003036 [Conoideocrella luteorostrata]|uniref:Proteophosphoglycan ppg4 n=1 Tax=Conoideocrella luteorostrata TaxID=1105319 RepID=A0AAJ0G2K4_9HYPO|nr:hypothetical protein QQS21_003036 [Conoideocrella luteorostrata]